MDIPTAVLAPQDKRIVLLHCRGPWAGIHQILGTQSDTIAEQDLTELPAFVEAAQTGDNRIVSLSMIRVTPRMILYRENTPPEGKFNENFHPSQQ